MTSFPFISESTVVVVFQEKRTGSSETKCAFKCVFSGSGIPVYITFNIDIHKEAKSFIVESMYACRRDIIIIIDIQTQL